PSDTPVCYLCTCEQCGTILSYGTCLNCNSGTGNSFTYDPIPESFDEVQISHNPPLQYHFNIYLCVNPLIDHHCCYECRNSLNDFFCYQCTCEFCGNDAHVGYNCPAQVPSFQTLPSFPQQYPCCEDCGVLSEADHCQPLRYTVNHPIFNAHNNFLDSQNELTIAQNKIIEQMTQLTSIDDQSCSNEDISEKIFLNPLFEEEIIPMKIDQHHFNAESDLIESMLNHDSSIIHSSSKIDYLLDEFAGELSLLKSIPPRINETDCDPEDEIRFIERLLYDNSSPSPPKEFVFENSIADIESFSPSPIPVEDSDSFIKEIDLTLTPNDPIPLSIKDDDDDSERDILICEELLDNYSLSLPVNESFQFDIPSFFHPPAKPPDGNT
nr:hypothetical protein [Tanacetum cinerariifolium]